MRPVHVSRPKAPRPGTLSSYRFIFTILVWAILPFRLTYANPIFIGYHYRIADEDIRVMLTADRALVDGSFHIQELPTVKWHDKKAGSILAIPIYVPSNSKLAKEVVDRAVKAAEADRVNWLDSTNSPLLLALTGLKVEMGSKTLPVWRFALSTRNRSWFLGHTILQPPEGVVVLWCAVQLHTKKDFDVRQPLRIQYTQEYCPVADGRRFIYTPLLTDGLGDEDAERKPQKLKAPSRTLTSVPMGATPVQQLRSEHPGLIIQNSPHRIIVGLQHMRTVSIDVQHQEAGRTP